jgi:hypothetical protein
MHTYYATSSWPGVTRSEAEQAEQAEQEGQGHSPAVWRHPSSFSPPGPTFSGFPCTFLNLTTSITAHYLEAGHSAAFDVAEAEGQTV